MTDDNRLFRFFGRFNTIIFAVVGVLVLLMIGVEIVPHWIREVRPLQADHHRIVATDGYRYVFSTDTAGANQAYGFDLVPLEGSKEGIVALQREPEYGSGSFESSRSEDREVNLLLIDLDTTRSHWMFPGVNRNIRSRYEIRASPAAADNVANPIVALLIIVEEVDTNKDGDLNGEDDDTLYVYKPGSAGAVKLMTAKKISSLKQLDSHKVFVTYYDGKVDRALLLSTTDFKAIAQSALADTPK